MKKIGKNIVNKKPIVDPIPTTIATIGEIIIATNIGKCDAGVAVKGPIIIFIPLNITGIIIARAISNAA